MSGAGVDVSNALVATLLGSVLAVLLLVPTAAVQYRRDGRLGPGDLLTLLAAAVYGLALWTYTLLPLPDRDDLRCAGRQLEPLGSIRPALDRSAVGLELLADPAFLQVALNVLLFVPFGFFVRRVLRRGVVVATLAGAATSALIEVTQVTGVWGLFPCAYRVLDVDDLLLNTLGAVLGSLLSAPVVRRRPDRPRPPTRLTLGRRWTGMVCDLLVVVLVGAAAGAAYRAWSLLVADRTPDVGTQQLWQLAAAGAVQGGCVLLLGRTAGEWTVDLRTRLRRRGPVLLARLLKLAVGVGPLVVLVWLEDGEAPLALPVLLLVTGLVAWRTRGHRGISGVVSGLEPEVDSDQALEQR